ncbi:MAG: alpha/beta hydrolase [Vicinamibacterales bacterium]|nr:alpha/beta hydrolase [Vicinamibacterales bacterium]
MRLSVADHRNLVYTTVPRPLRLDLYVPAASAPVPVIVWIHGGGWQSGDKSLSASHPALQQRSRGYAVASIEYRLSGESTFPAQIADCKAAIRWLRANAGLYGLDVNRVGVWGSSAGGHLAALVGTSGGVSQLEDLSQGNPAESSRVRAVVDWYGPVDFLQMFPSHLLADSPESRLLGCTVTACPDRVAMANPITYIDTGDPPFFIQHGSADGTVNPAQSELLHAALQEAGVASTHQVLPGAGHGGAAFTASANVALVAAFLDAYLR